MTLFERAERGTIRVNILAPLGVATRQTLGNVAHKITGPATATGLGRQTHRRQRGWTPPWPAREDRWTLALSSLLAALCGGIPSLAAAQAVGPAVTASAPDRSAQKLAPVVVVGKPDTYRAPDSATATRTDTPSLQNAQSVQVVPRAVIADQNALNLTEAVRNVAGVQFDFGFNGSAQPLFILRGFPSVSMTATGSMSGSSTYYVDGSKVSGVPINMANVASVEVIKGPSSVLYGRAEPGGLVNVVSKPISPLPESSVEQTIGQYNLSRTAVEASGPITSDSTLRGRFAASYYTTDSIRDFVTDKLGAVTGSLAWIPDARTSVTATLDYTNQRYRTDYGVPAIGDRPADLPWSSQFNDAPDLSSARTTSLRIDASRQLDDTWKIQARALTLRSNTSEVDIAPYRGDFGLAATPAQGCPNSTGTVLCRYYFYVRPDGRYSLDQLNIDLTGKFATGSVQHTLLVGLDTYFGRKTGTTYLQQIASVNIYNPNLGSTPPLDIAASLPAEYDDFNRWTSLYVQDQLALGNGVFLTGALRHDRTSAIFATPGTAPNDASFTTPRVGAVWQFVPDQSVYAQYQEAVSANNGRDTVTLAPLAAERARQIEVGHKAEWLEGRLKSTVALYQLTKFNRGETVPIAAPPYTNVVAIGEARSRGIEWDISGQLNERLSLIGSYAYTTTRVLSDPTYQDKQLANVARNAGTLWARYQITSNWAAGGGVFAQGQRQGDIGNTFQLPGYARADAMLAYRFLWGSGRASLQFNLDNVFDTKYFAQSHQFVSDWIKLGSPRTAKLTLRIDY